MSVADRIARVLDTIEGTASDRAFITVDRVGAMAAAHAADERRAAGVSLGPLDGEPVVVKDNLDTAGLRTTLGLGIHRDRVPAVDADVVRRLRTGGAVIVGKTNLTELACGTVGVNVHYGDVANPHHPDRYAGGSSSGSAAAIAAGVVDHAIGTDTGGSIRHPAAVCGIVGLKPTFGRTSNAGVSVCARSMDHVGPMSASSADAADLLAVIQVDGPDDPRSLLATPLTGTRVAILTGEFLDACDADVVAAFEPAVALLESLGCEIDELDLGLDLRAVDDEVANLLGADLVDEYGDLLTRAGRAAVGPELWGWYDRYEQVGDDARARAAEEQRRLRRRVSAAIADVDVAVAPTTRTRTGTIAQGQAADRFDRVGNLALWDVTGHPSLTVPFGTDAHGLPLGLLVNGHLDADARVLQVGHAVEQAVGRARGSDA